MTTHDILRMLARAPMTGAEIRAATTAFWARSHTDGILARLAKQKLLVETPKGWRLTERGITRVVIADSTKDWGRYQPERVVRRAGSLRASALPSRMGDNLVERSCTAEPAAGPATAPKSPDSGASSTKRKRKSPATGTSTNRGRNDG
jgi:hypothetical protein